MQGSSLTRNFAVFFHRCFTPEVHTRTDDHATQSYSSALFKSASSLSHWKNSAVASLANLVTAGNSLLRHSHNLPLFNSNHCFEQNSTTHTPFIAVTTPLDLDWLHFLVHHLNGWTCVIRLLSNLPRNYPGAICVHSGWYSGLFPLATLLRRSLSGCRSASKPVVVGALRTQHNPASQCLHRSSVSRIGNAALCGAASCEQSFFWKHSMDGGDRCEAAERTIHVQHVKGARSQTRNSQTRITLQCIVYCNKEHSHQNTCSLYTGGNLADAGSLELPPWNPPASWSLPWALHVPSDHYAIAKLTQF